MSKYDIYLYENSNVLKNILNITDDAICTEPIDYSDDTELENAKSSKYEKYHTKDYKAKPHEYSED